MEIVLLDQLNVQHQRCKIKTRLSRLWEATIPQLKNQNFPLECLLIDEKGYSMQAIIQKHDADQFKDLLVEGAVYIIENFNVVPAREKFKVIDRKYMIRISKWTKIIESKDNAETIPLYSFNFVSFDDIGRQKNGDGCLLDVLGSIVAISPISYTYVRQQHTAIRNMEIQNSEANTFAVTLWDKFALEFDDNLVYGKETISPVVVVLASMTVRSYRDKLHLSTCSASRLYINLEIPEVTLFRAILQSKQVPIGSIQHIEVPEQPTLSPYEQMVVNRKMVGELLTLDSAEAQTTKYTCKAKLVEIDTTYGWWYKACYDCKGGVRDYDGAFWCGQCGKSDQAPIPWYKLNAVVEDETGSVDFIIFGKLAQELIGVPAQQLAAAAGSDRYKLPHVIRNLLGQSFIFQVLIDARRFNTSSQAFRVAKIFHINLEKKIKTEEKEEGQAVVEGSGPSNSKELDDHVFEQTPPSAITQEVDCQCTPDIVAARLRSRKRSLSYIDSSGSEEEEK